MCHQLNKSNFSQIRVCHLGSRTKKFPIPNSRHKMWEHKRMLTACYQFKSKATNIQSVVEEKKIIWFYIVCKSNAWPIAHTHTHTLTHWMCVCVALEKKEKKERKSKDGDRRKRREREGEHVKPGVKWRVHVHVIHSTIESSQCYYKQNIYHARNSYILWSHSFSYSMRQQQPQASTHHRYIHDECGPSYTI